MDYKGFMSDFTIADHFGISAIKDTYRRAFSSWKNDVNYYASLVLTLNHKIWEWHGKNEKVAKVYDELWRKADSWGSKHFKGKDAEYYFSFLD